MPLIRTDYFLSPYQTGRWILEINGTHFIISDYTKKLIDILSQTENYKDAAEIFNFNFENENLNDTELESLTEKVFYEIPIFKNSNIEIKESKSYIKFQKQLFNPSLAGNLSSFLSFLFNKKLFWITFSGLAFMGIFLIIKTSLSSFNNLSPLPILIIYTFTMFLHELGHIAACKKYTGKNGEIGFGIYFIFPVLYSNISSVWLANKEERVITNLAGIYMQLLCMFILYIFYLFFDNTTALYLSYFIAFYCLFQVSPFIRSDGYWLLSDLTSTSNLLKKSDIEVRSFIKNPKTWLKEKREKKTFLLSYGLFNYAILIYFILTQLIFNWKEILNFPVYIINTLKHILTARFDEIYFDSGFITVIIFYILLFNQISNIYKRYSDKATKNKTMN